MSTPQSPEISISIVSHGQMPLVTALLHDLARYAAPYVTEVLLTLNLPEELPFENSEFQFPLRVIRNTAPMGFGANHNQAAARAVGKYVCILNPDIRLGSDVFGPLLHVLKTSPDVGLVAPGVLNAHGQLEDSARYFPTPWEILGKALGRRSRRFVARDHELSYPDWVGGMFMLLPLDTFRAHDGFDERYFLYYEDVDLCARLQLAHVRVAWLPAVSVIHDAQRTSHRNLKYLRWHISSMLRYFMSSVYWDASSRKWIMKSTRH